MSKYFKVEFTKIYIVEIDDNSLTEEDNISMATNRVLDEVERFELETHCIDAIECNPNELTKMEKMLSTSLTINPAEYYEKIKLVKASD